MVRLLKNVFWRIVPHTCRWYGTGVYPTYGTNAYWGAGAERCRCCYCGRWSH